MSLLRKYPLENKNIYNRHISVINLNILKCEFYAFIFYDLICLVDKNNNFQLQKKFKFNHQDFQDFDRINVYQINNNNIEFLIFGKNIYSKKMRYQWEE